MSEEESTVTGSRRSRHWKITARPIFTIAELIRRRNKPAVYDIDHATPYPALRPLADGTWQLLDDWNCEYEDNKYTVPKGFITDGASIPKCLWPIYGSPMEYPYPLSATLHDYLYVTGCKTDPDPRGETRKNADKAFRDYNIQLGMSKFKAYTEYWAIRLCGGSHWNDETPGGEQ